MVLVVAASCPPGDEPATVASHPPDSQPAAAEAAPSLVRRVSFEQIQPFLDRCQPCHFPGGKMYDKLPFDRPQTVHLLGEKLFTRIHDEGERQLIRDFLKQPAEPAS